ncbi:hypothetical protein [Lonepinella sp. BR2357]|uniref:hypothetical protein n=1 Tax=Lonepinella sp. BR2357 TaxID=3434549 RepID=UPI003F6E30BC
MAKIKTVTELDIGKALKIDNDKVNVVVSKQDGNIIEIKDDGLFAKSAGGSTDFDLSTIPEKAFETGSKVIAFDPKGKVYQFPQNENILTDVGVSLSASSATVTTSGTKYDVTLKITNASNTSLSNAVAVLYTNGELSNLRLPDGVTQSDLTFTVATLDAYATKTITFTITITDNQYVSATVSVAGDMVKSNNTASINLAAVAESAAKNNVFTESCPLIPAYVVGYETQPLKQSAQASGSSPRTRKVSGNVLAKESLKGVQIKFDGASTVLVRSGSGNIPTFFIKETSEFNYHILEKEEPNEYQELGAKFYSFDVNTGILTFADDYPYTYAVIYARPNSADCMWQAFHISASQYDVALNVTQNRIEVSGLDSSLYSYKYGAFANNVPAYSSMESAALLDEQIIGDQISDYRYVEDNPNIPFPYRKDEDHDISYTSLLEVKLVQGQAYSFDLITPNRSALPELQGNVAISKTSKGYHVEVQATASKTDEVYRDNVRIIIQ